MEKLLRFLMWVVGLAVVIGVGLRLTILTTWTVPDDPLLSASLQPTMAGGDTVIVLTVGTPSFGELVRCPDPEDPTRFVVGRVVGMTGDQIELRSQSLRVNGKPYNATEACKEPTFTVEHPDTGHEMEMQCSRVEMGGGWHFRGTLKGKRRKRNDKKKTVGAGKYFLLSDNRDMHDDSRDYGTLPEETCTERIVFRLWGPGGWTESDRRMTVIR